MKRNRIAVTGLGAASVAGPDVSSLANGLWSAKRLFGPSTRHQLGFDVSVGEAEEKCFAEHDFPALASPTSDLCLKAARECVADAASRGAKAPKGLVLGTSTGGQSKNEELVFSILDGHPPSAYSFRAQGCMAAPSRLVARDLDIHGPILTISTACTSSANAIALGASWIESGRLDSVLVGGGDALCYTTLSSFHMLKLTSEAFSRPFGVDRPGLTLGDGTGFLMIENLERVLESGRTPLAELMGYGMSSDAHHMTAPLEDGAGAELAIRKALQSAGLKADDIEYINAHGTGTELNDAAEAVAIERVFGGEIPVMSVKGLLGHTLGGAGGIEAVVSVLSITERHAFENIGVSVSADDCPIALIQPGGMELCDSPFVISTSFAFGGNNCALVFGAIGGAR